MNIKTRFAPSPTGYLHIGSLRTALYSFLFARHHAGVFLLRIEDTDRTRYVEGAIESLIKTLARMGLDYDEGPVLVDGRLEEKGENGPYTQSARLELYTEHARRLIEQGDAYYCFCSRERLEDARKAAELSRLPTKYDRTCLRLTPEEVRARLEAGEKPVVRLHIPEGETTFEDIIRGSVTIQNEQIDDQVLLKADGFPTYHLAVVVDDHLMGVTHIIRGEEWISSVPKHVHLYRAFGWAIPVYAHLPLILNPDKSKLSKRQGDVAVEEYLTKGYLPEALLNYVALLGFNPTGDREIYTLRELIEAFDLSKVNKSGAVFDVQKLDWMNGMYIRSMDLGTLMERAEPFLGGAGKALDAERLKKILAVEQERMTTLTEIVEHVRPYVESVAYDAALLVWKKSTKEDARAKLEGVHELLSAMAPQVFDDVALIETEVKRYIEDKGFENGPVLWPMRVALSGSQNSASPFQIAWILGREETLARLAHAIEYLSS
ncbi:glutamate--tRNA ligase [Candidatus Uhrbacteria bacterium]|nr:glutamate--tRNA ligase [Candidatus Uhrbacteria bacterium]